MLIQLAVLLAAIVPGATNNRILVLGPKAKTASEDVRLAAVAALATTLEKDRLISRRLQDGNLVDLKGKKLLRDPIAVQLRSLLQAGCEGAVCGANLRRSFSALGGVARVRIKPLGEKGGLITVWLSGLRSDGSFAPRKERRVVVTSLGVTEVSAAVTDLATGLARYKVRADAAPATMVVPEVAAAEEAKPESLTGLAPWNVVADADRKAMQAELENQRAAEDERTAKIEAEKKASLEKIRAAEETEAAEALAKATAAADARKLAEKNRIDAWKKGGIAGEVGLHSGPMFTQDSGGDLGLGDVSFGLAAQLRMPLGTPGVRLGLGVSGGALPTQYVRNPQTQDDEAWVQLSHDDTNSEVAERQDLPGEQFWYKYEYVYFVQLDGRFDVQLGAAPVGLFVSGGLGLNVSHGRVYNLQFDVDEENNIIDDTGTERRDPSDEFTWPSLQSSFGAGIWFQAPKFPVALSLGYRRYTGHLSGLRTMARPVAGENVERVFNTTLAREILAVDLTYRF